VGIVMIDQFRLKSTIKIYLLSRNLYQGHGLIFSKWIKFLEFFERYPKRNYHIYILEVASDVYLELAKKTELGRIYPPFNFFEEIKEALSERNQNILSPSDYEYLLKNLEAKLYHEGVSIKTKTNSSELLKIDPLFQSLEFY
jgi:hypothetical protein